jgi:heme-degrading monooxygenase HmoA
MFVTVWKFVVRPENAEEFERHYGPEGTWAQLFSKAPGYIRTELYTGAPGEYLTLDFWETPATYLEFKAARGAEYAELDSRLESLTEREEAIVSA